MVHWFAKNTIFHAAHQWKDPFLVALWTGKGVLVNMWLFSLLHAASVENEKDEDGDFGESDEEDADYGDYIDYDDYEEDYEEEEQGRLRASTLSVNKAVKKTLITKIMRNSRNVQHMTIPYHWKGGKKSLIPILKSWVSHFFPPCCQLQKNAGKMS